jgi:hypothetical protein
MLACTSILFNNRSQNMIQPVRFYFKHGGKVLPQLSVWESFSAVPLQIVHGKLRDISALILSIRHAGPNKFDEEVRFHGFKLTIPKNRIK